MTATRTVPSSVSTAASNLDFYLDDFPPPRPSTSALLSPPMVREPSLKARQSSIRLSVLRVPMPSSSKAYGLPSNPRSPCSPRSLEKGIRRFPSHRPKSGLRGALSSIFQHRSEPELDIPIQDVSPEGSSVHEDIHLSPWPSLHIEKRPATRPDSCPCTDPKRRRRRRLFLVLLVILLFYLLGDTIFLDIQVLSSTTATQYGARGNKFILSPAQELCLTQFTVNAPANASLYPCSTCLGFLQDIPTSFKFATSDGVQMLSNSLQFCGLQSLLVSSGPTAQNSLVNGGWVQDIGFCTWTGVQCDSQGNVKSLEMIFPAVPSVIPSGISALRSLQSLQITGGNGSPAGALPDSFANLTSLMNLHLENTALSAPPSTLFRKGALNSITSLTLVLNPGFAGSLPDVSGLALQSFVVSNQELSTPLADLVNSTTLRDSLTTLSLTSTNLTGSFPSSLISFPSLQTLSLANNSALSGPVPDSICQSTTLQNCDLRGTGLMPTDGSCGGCLF